MGALFALLARLGLTTVPQARPAQQLARCAFRGLTAPALGCLLQVLVLRVSLGRTQVLLGLSYPLHANCVHQGLSA